MIRDGAMSGLGVHGGGGVGGVVMALPAGWAIVELADDFVLPPGTDQIVLCQFDSEHPYLTDALGWETNIITDSLTVRLGESVDTA